MTPPTYPFHKGKEPRVRTGPNCPARGAFYITYQRIRLVRRVPISGRVSDPAWPIISEYEPNPRRFQNRSHSRTLMSADGAVVCDRAILIAVIDRGDLRPFDCAAMVAVEMRLTISHHAILACFSTALRHARRRAWIGAACFRPDNGSAGHASRPM